MSAHRPLRVYLLLLCVALLCARVGGVYLHLCLDGQEPPVSAHLSEPDHHDRFHGSPTHSDRDVSLADDALTPLYKLFADLPPLLAALWFGLLLMVTAHAIPPAGPNSFAPQTRFRRPPLRGPPFALPLTP